MKTLFLFLAICLPLALTACQPRGKVSAPTAAATSDGTKSGGSTSTPGTISGGGGNGIDGRMMEAYAKSHTKSIESLPEYREHVLPVLRRMNRGKPDVLIAYLTWAARHKAWYFIPHELPQLGRDQIQLFFKTEQFAVHQEQEIFVNSAEYDKKSKYDKAILLLHEMVMAAKMLMKKSPQAQCEALSLSSRVLNCKDPETLKLAIAPPVLSETQQATMNGLDHERIRMMTVYLLDEKQDLFAHEVAAMRSRLGFNFPWDATLSNFTYDELMLILKRHQLAEDQYVHRPFVTGSSQAQVTAQTTNDAADLCRLDFTSGNNYGSRALKLYILDREEREKLRTMLIENRLYDSSRSIGIYQFNYYYDPTERHTSGELEYEPEIVAAAGDAKGVMNPEISNKIVDHFRISPKLADDQYSLVADFYVSREENPQVLEFRISHVRGLGKKQSLKSPFNDETVEAVQVKSSPVIRCVLNQGARI